MLGWYAQQARDLPWRRPDATPWSILVSEFMLQQTPVARVLGPWQLWVERWPEPAALADAPVAEAIRAWGRLGYPRRAIRLHGAAVAIRDQHGGEVPADHAALLALPGVGSYTAAAVASFAFRQRHVVLDTNVRRLLARVVSGVAYPTQTPTTAEMRLAESFVPMNPERAAQWAVASMELGAVVCTARSPRCQVCPLRRRCAWRKAGYRSWDGRPRKGQSYAGSDRQCRGALLALLRSADQPVEPSAMESVWAEDVQRDRALTSLLADGLAIELADGLLTLPR